MGSGLILHTRVVTGSGGGPDKTILNSPRFLRDQGYPMICAYMRHPKDEYFHVLEKRAEHWQAPLLAVDDHGPVDLGVVRRFIKICKEHRPAIWHGHDYKSNLVGLIVNRYVPMKLVTTVHGWVKHTWKTPLYYAIDKFCLKRYEHVICVSQDLYDDCLRLGVPESRCSHVPNAIDTDEFKRKLSREEAKRELKVPADAFLLGAVGRLSKEKGFDLLIEAVSRLAATGKNVLLWIAGEGDAQEELQTKILSLGLADRVKLLGFQSNLALFYQAMDLFVLSSLREGLPNVLLEAMAFGTPILSTRIAGIPKLIDDQKTGILIEPGSVDELEQAIARLLADTPLRERLAAAGRQKIETEFSFYVRMQRIKAIYDRILDGTKKS